MKVVMRGLRLAGGLQRFGQFGRRTSVTPEPAAFGDLGVAEMRIEFGADEIVVEPQDRIALLGAPLVIAEHHHGDARPFSRPIELISFMEMPKAPSPAKPTQGVSGLPILAPTIDGKP